MKAFRMVFAAALSLIALSCGSKDSNDGKITVLLKDATADVRAAFVTIAEVDLIGDGGAVVLMTTPVTTNLLTLANDVATLVDGAVIPAGSYSELRFVITGGYLDVAGAIYASSPTYEGLPPNATVAGELRMPSYGKSGLKVKLPAGFTVGSDSVLLVDFDVSQSFGHDAGGSGAWVMHPVIKATEVKDTGAIQVKLALGSETVLPDGLTLASFRAVLAPPGANSVPAQLIDQGDGTVGVTFSYLVPGSYQVSFLGPENVEVMFVISPEIPAAVPVTAGQTTEAPFFLMGAEIVPPP